MGITNVKRFALVDKVGLTTCFVTNNKGEKETSVVRDTKLISGEKETNKFRMNRKLRIESRMYEV